MATTNVIVGQTWTQVATNSPSHLRIDQLVPGQRAYLFVTEEDEAPLASAQGVPLISSLTRSDLGSGYVWARVPSGEPGSAALAVTASDPAAALETRIAALEQGLVTFPAPADVESGLVYLIEALVVVALEDADEGDEAAFATRGVYVLPKSDDTGPEFEAGEVVYWDPDGELAEVTGPTHFPIGVALVAAADDDDSVTVLLNAPVSAVVGGD